jgi:hypothetical protein
MNLHDIERVSIGRLVESSGTTWRTIVFTDNNRKTFSLTVFPAEQGGDVTVTAENQIVIIGNAVESEESSESS